MEKEKQRLTVQVSYNQKRASACQALVRCAYKEISERRTYTSFGNAYHDRKQFRSPYENEHETVSDYQTRVAHFLVRPLQQRNSRIRSRTHARKLRFARRTDLPRPFSLCRSFSPKARRQLAPDPCEIRRCGVVDLNRFAWFNQQQMPVPPGPSGRAVPASWRRAPVVPR